MKSQRDEIVIEKIYNENEAPSGAAYEYLRNISYLERIRLNMYPGVIFASSFSPGLFFTFGESGTYAAGSTMQISPVGIGLNSPH
jgi:hypothetical protein